MANSLTPTSIGSAKRALRRSHPSMSQNHLQAYFIARETLRRLKSAPTPCVPPAPSIRAGSRASSQAHSTS